MFQESKKKINRVCSWLLVALVLFLGLYLSINSKGIISSLYKSLIANGAYVGIFRGLGITGLLTLVGTILATIFAILLSFLSLCGIATLEKVAVFLITVFRGVPVAILLMILYFCVFPGRSLDAIYVAFIGFGLNIGAHMAEIFSAAYRATNKGEVEAARMLGFSALGAFFYVSLPQSWQVAQPSYENMIISLLQWTTIAGYISVTELSRIVNGIGSRIANPFYALFLGAMLYLGMAYFIRFIFYITRRRFDYVTHRGA